MNDAEDPQGPRLYNPLDRTQAISRSLAEAARRARFLSRSRGSNEKSSFAARRGAKFMRIMRLVLFIGLVAIPNVISIAYFGFLASDEFVSEAEFTVSSGAIPKMDGLGSVTGLPPAAIVQDTQIITNYIESRAMVEALERDIDLRGLYSADSIDWWSRFKKDKPIEKFADYWRKMVKTSITFPSGLVKLSVRAFEPKDAKRVADAVIARCETLVNGLNDRMRKDTVDAAETDLRRMMEKLKDTQLKLEQARNAEELLDVRQASATLNQLLTDLEAELLKGQSDYQTQSRYVSETTPQMRVLKSRLASLEAQIQKVKAQITEQQEKSVDSVAQHALSGKMTKFAILDLEHQIAEKSYATATVTLDAAKMLAERKMLYLHQAVPPAVPEDPRYPRRQIDVGLVLVGSLVLWATMVGLASFVRNNMA